MKFLKQLLILILALVSIVLIVALFVKKDFHVSRSIEIERNTLDVFDYVRYLENQENYATWSMEDPNIIQSYSGPEGNIGSIYKWDSKIEDVGAGEQEIIQLTENEKIEYELRFKKPWESKGKAHFTFESISNSSTKVTWEFEGGSSWPWNIMLLFMNMEEELGPDLEQGLNNLKNTLEVED
jgi:hypothetical protein